MNKERLLDVAKALRETKDADRFTMERFGHPCGTPACAMGHYAAREDLQGEFTLDNYGDLEWRGTTVPVNMNSAGFLEYFGITSRQMEMLFESYGCNRAQSAEQAADYIEDFVKENGFE